MKLLLSAVFFVAFEAIFWSTSIQPFWCFMIPKNYVCGPGEYTIGFIGFVISVILFCLFLKYLVDSLVQKVQDRMLREVCKGG